jgi:hypothetical protein
MYFSVILGITPFITYTDYSNCYVYSQCIPFECNTIVKKEILEMAYASCLGYR